MYSIGGDTIWDGETKTHQNQMFLRFKSISEISGIPKRLYKERVM
jgi:hypothetical protein